MTCTECDIKKNKRRTVDGMPMLANAINGSPVLAYAWALGLPFVPFHLNIRQTFVQGGPKTSQVVSFEGSNQRLNVSSICEAVNYQIDAPGYNAGQALKPVSDFFFQRQSGIQATMVIDGAPRYVVAPFPTPIETLMSSMQEGWPGGWVLEYTQNVTMQFTQTVTLPSFPTTITVTFRLWQPGNGQALDLVGMTNDIASEKLARLIATGTAVRTNNITSP